MEILKSIVWALTLLAVVAIAAIVIPSCLGVECCGCLEGIYWIGGVAAALLLVLLGGSHWLEKKHFELEEQAKDKEWNRQQQINKKA